MESRRLQLPFLFAFVAVVVVLLFEGCHGAVNMNHIRMVGTHNSYHIPSLRATIPQWTDTKATLTNQLFCTTTRKFEIDFFPETNYPVGHVKQYDSNSNCANLSACFQEIAAWSAAHTDHLPIYVFLEAKTDPSVSQWNEIDALIRAEFGDSNLLVPDTVQGSAQSLQAAVTSTGWPSLSSARGKIVVVLNSAYTAYLVSGDLNGRAAFMTCDFSARTSVYCAVVGIDNPSGSGGTDINQAVSEGFMVRTRADNGYIPGTWTNDTEILTYSFYMLDLNNDGISVSEITNFFQEAGGVTLNQQQQLALNILVSTCSGGSGKATLSQYLTCIIPTAASNGYSVSALLGNITTKAEAITQANTALGTNAHWVDTDYPVPTLDDDFSVTLPSGGHVECLSVFAAQGCTSADLQETTVPTTTCGACCGSESTSCTFATQTLCPSNVWKSGFTCGAFVTCTNSSLPVNGATTTATTSSNPSSASTGSKLAGLLQLLL